MNAEISKSEVPALHAILDVLNYETSRLVED